jgi:tetratricopeptide (TPR) repeat protein
MATAASRPVLEKIARDYAGTRYAPWCLHALGSFSLSVMDALIEEGPKAERAYREVLERYPDYPLRDEVRIHLSKVYLKSGRSNAAIAIAEQMLAESEDNLYLFRDADVMRAYRGERNNPYAGINKTNWELFGTTQLPDAYEQLRYESLPSPQ